MRTHHRLLLLKIDLIAFFSVLATTAPLGWKISFSAWDQEADPVINSALIVFLNSPPVAHSKTIAYTELGDSVSIELDGHDNDEEDNDSLMFSVVSLDSCSGFSLHQLLEDGALLLRFFPLFLSLFSSSRLHRKPYVNKYSPCFFLNLRASQVFALDQ